MTQLMAHAVIQSLKVKYRLRMIEQIIKVIDVYKLIPKVTILDAMKMLIICWEGVIEETIKNCFGKTHISSKHQNQLQIDLHDTFIELRNNMERLESFGFNEIPKYFAPEDFRSFVDAVVTTELTLSDGLIISMSRNSEIEEEVEKDEEDDDHTMRANDKFLEKPTPVAINSTIKTSINFIFLLSRKKCNGILLKF